MNHQKLIKMLRDGKVKVQFESGEGKIIDVPNGLAKDADKKQEAYNNLADILEKLEDYE